MDHIIDAFAGTELESEELLTKFGQDLAEKRDEAVLARKEYGIESVWEPCEDAYLCIDESNRSETSGNKWSKPTSITGGLISNSSKQKNSSAFVRLTPRYVDMGAAKVADILLALGGEPFNLKPTPVPNLVNSLGDMRPAMHPVTGVPMSMPPQPTAPNAPTATPASPARMTRDDVAKNEMKAAKDAADKAKARIYDWLTESNFASEMRTVIFDAARIGTGVLKAPVPVMRKSMAVEKNNGAIALKIKLDVVPSAKRIDAWNLFPHPACGENVNDGDWIFERDFLSPQSLKELKKDPTYLSGQIDKVMKEGPGKCLSEGMNPNEKTNKHRYEVFYFIGTVKRSDMMLTNAIGLDELPDEVEDVYAIATLINDTVIRAVINPMQSGSFNYHVFAWSRRAGSWTGVGVAEQVSMPQRMVNAGTRALLNNGGLSGGLQIVMDPLSVVAADGNPVLEPNKLWYKTADATIEDMRAAFVAIEFPNVGPQMMAIIDYAFKLAEEACNIPLIAQGQEGKLATTFGEAELRDTNANTLLRAVGLAVSDKVIDPAVRGFYEWLMLDQNVPDDEKGDYQVDVSGCTAMIEKSIQEQVIPQIMQMSLQPAYKLDPQRAAKEYLISKRLDPDKYTFSEDEIAEQAKAQQPPPIQLQIEQAKGQNAMQLQQAKTQAELQQSAQNMQHEQQLLQSGGSTPHEASAMARIEQARINAESAGGLEASKARTEIMVETSRAKAEENRAQKELEIATQNGQFKLQQMQMQRDLALLDYAQKHQITLEQVKADLAKTTMQEQTKRELSAAEIQLAQNQSHEDRSLDLHKHQTSLQRDMMTTNNTP